MNGAQESIKDISRFPETLVQNITQDIDTFRFVDGLQEGFERCYDLGVLPAELPNISWALAGIVVDMRGYKHFPSWEK